MHRKSCPVLSVFYDEWQFCGRNYRSERSGRLKRERRGVEGGFCGEGRAWF